MLRVQKRRGGPHSHALTRRHGKLRAVAKGVRRTRSRWGARLEPFNHVDVQCYTGRSLDVVTQAQTVAAFGAGIINDYPRYTVGCAMLETADRLVAEEGEPALRVYLLLVGAIRGWPAVADPPLGLDSFSAGHSQAVWAPRSTLRPCAEPARTRVQRAAGSGLPAAVRRLLTPSTQTFALLDALLHGDWTPRTARGRDRRTSAWPPTCSGTLRHPVAPPGRAPYALNQARVS